MGKRRLIGYFIPILMTLFLLVLLELLLSLSYGNDESYFVGKPFLEYQYEFHSKYVTNMSDLIHVKLNSIGARSDKITKNHQEKIIAIGGSTTECNTVDQPLSWTEIVQDNLSKSIGKQFWVGNFGKSGTSSQHHILQTQELLKLKTLSDAKTVIYLIGFNDALKSLKNPKRYLYTPLLDLRRQAFMVVPNRDLSYLKSLAIYKFIKEKAFYWRMNRVSKEIFDSRHEKNKGKRAQAIIKKDLPDLRQQLSQYKENISFLIDLNIKNNKKPIFISQPVLWNENLDPNLKDMQVFDIMESYCYSPDALAKLMDLFNNALLEVCEKKNVDCIDLAKKTDVGWFYDDCHFNLIGSKEVGAIISTEIESILR